MPLTENDIVRIRQFLQKMDSGLIEGMEIFATYHDSNLASTPSNPTGDGTTGGWHREPTEASNWMSVKTALKDTGGTWGTPIRVFGLQGTETAGVGLSADIPKLEQITFIGDAATKVGWTAGTVRYGGNSYAIEAKAVSDGSTDAYIYWDDDDGQTSFKTTATFATAIAANHWVVCINDTGKAIPASSARIIHGGLIQALTITAALIQADAIETDKINGLAVETAKIDNSATRIYAASGTSSESTYDYAASPNYRTINTQAITSLGGAIKSTVRFEITSVTNAVSVRFHDGVTVHKTWAAITVGEYQYTIVDTPGSGAFTYTLDCDVKSSGAGTQLKVAQRAIELVEDKGK
jgi:hypothetical protein